jgi:rhodanese-related sulfurtransferase
MNNTNKKSVYVILAVLVMIIILSFILFQKENTENNSNSYIDISSLEAKNLIEQNPDLIIIDVSPNYAEGHLPEAINYYVGDGSLDEAIPTLDKEATYLVYCHIDSASKAGAQKLVDAGFENVYRLESHYSGWVEAGYEIEM